MNAAFLIVFFLIGSSQAAVCLPDSVNLTFAEDSIADLRPMEEAASQFESQITPMLPQHHDLTINLEPNNPRINAEIVKNNQLIVLSVWGGMMAHPLMTSETFLLLLCHEVGHLLGGSPLKARDHWSSTEGQADYYSTAKCARRMGLQEGQVIDGALNLSRIYAQVTSEPAPKLDRSDSTRPVRTNYGYPPVQCRLDTLLAGWRGMKRPSCWFVN